MTRILIIENKSLHPHRLRAHSRSAGISLTYEFACTPGEVCRMIERGPAMLVAPLAGIPGLPLARIVERAQAMYVPLLLVGGDTEAERVLLTEHRNLYKATCRRSRLPWLPMLLERTLGTAEGRPMEPNQPAYAPAQMREIQRLVTIGQLAGSIAHEINNPLEAVTNLVYIVGSDPALPEQLRSYLDLAQQELGRVAQISKQTLSFYRESQVPVRVELSSLLEEVVVLYTRRLSEKNIHLERRYESEEPVLIFPGEMRQVYANLLANAIEATPPGGRITLRLHRSRRWRLKPEAGIRVVVADSGPGIPADVRAKLGQPFYTTKGQRGTGLGLWVSQSILKRYDGEMQLRSSTRLAHQGTTFSIFVPVEPRLRVVEPISTEAAHPPKEDGDDGLQLCANGS